MTRALPDDLWREFPKTAPEFEKWFATEEECRAYWIAADARVVTDGHAGYNEKSLGERSHSAVVQTKAERRDGDAVQACHWTTSLLKRWLLGTHVGADSDKHLHAYLDEFAFRHNCRKTDGVCRIAARVIESLVAKPPLTMRQIVDHTHRCRWFTSPQAEPA